MLDLDPLLPEEITVTGHVGLSWPALLSQPVGDTQYLYNAQDYGQSSENFATVTANSSRPWEYNQECKVQSCINDASSNLVKSSSW
jgi:hypothetical protein